MPYDIKGIVKPPYGIPAKESGWRRGAQQEVKLPPAIRAFAWICFARAGFDFICGGIVGLAPNSATAIYLGETFGSRIAILPPEPEFLLFGVLFLLFGWRWMARDWRVRWICMFLSGAVAARTLILVFADFAAAAHGRVLNTNQEAEMVLSAILNLFICAYLAFYPGMAQAFKETP